MISEKKKKFDFLVTGIAGYIGLNLAEYLLKKKYTVLVIYNFSNSKKINIKNLINNFSNFKFYSGSFDNVPNKTVVKNIIHLAAKSVVEKNALDLKEYKINNEHKLNIFLKIKNLNAKNLFLFRLQQYITILIK